jgi:multisubunit Na+/H+ antiporter MnhG subunit
MTVTGEILCFLATILLLILTDAYILWDKQDELRIFFTILINFAVILSYSIARDKLAGHGGDAITKN